MSNDRTDSADPHRPTPPTPWAHSHAEAEFREIVRTLEPCQALTLARIRELCWADHWPAGDFDASLKNALAAGEIKQLGDDLYEIAPAAQRDP